jgi:hypothetical protein
LRTTSTHSISGLDRRATEVRDGMGAIYEDG